MKLFVLFLFPIFLASFCIAAEPQQETLAPVVVTATRIETPQEEVATSITVITAEDIRTQQSETVLEALRNVPGLDVVQSGSRGNVTSVFIRGSESDHVLVLIDGAEVNSTTTSAFDFAHLTTESVERIEVLRGAGGTLYGSQAIGGVINIITKAGRGKPELAFSAEGGNLRTHRQVLSLRGGMDRLGYSLSASRLETAGFHRSDNDDYQNVATSGRLDFRVTDDASLRGIFHFRRTDLGLFNSNNFIRGAGDPNARQNVTDYIFRFDWEHKLLPKWDYRLSGSQSKQHLKFTDDPEPGSFDVVTRNRFRPTIAAGDFQTNYRLGEWSTTTLGVEYKNRRAKVTTRTSTTIREGQGNVAYYLQEQLRFFDRFFLVAGVRLDDHESFGTEWSPAFSAAYLLKESGTKIKMGYSEGFKVPSLNELFLPSFTPGCPSFGNPDLGPEKSWEVNAGFEQDLFKNRFKLSATYFHREVKDLIEGRPTSVDPILFPLCPPFITSVFRAQNVGRTRFDGLEWGINIGIFSGLSLGTNYTLLETDTSRGRLARRPRHRGNIVLNFQRDRFHINLNANIVGKRDDIGAVTFRDVKEAGHVKVDLASSYNLPWKFPGVKSLSLYGKIENLFNKRYEEADGFLARPLNFLIGIRGVFGQE